MIEIQFHTIIQDDSKYTKMEGRCQCGAIRFTTTVPQPLKVFVCHCLECRRQSASAYGISAIFPVFEPSTTSAQGWDDTEKVGVYKHITPKGRTKSCYFCKSCGTRLFHIHEGAKACAVKAGCLEGIDAGMVKSATHIWTSRALVPVPEGNEAFEEDPPS